ncbi:MAG: hypothetical protein VX278_13730, partial [Myxococcota bacterium]|nr:hypothetical protein [Myxococcota bacterium]
MKPSALLLSLPFLCGASFWVASIPEDGLFIPAQTCADALERGLYLEELRPSPSAPSFLPYPDIPTVEKKKKLPRIYNKGKRIYPKNFLPEELPLQPLEGTYEDLASIGDVMRQAADGQRVRFTFFGASHTEGEYWTGHIRRVLQTRYGDIGHGFIMPTPLFKGMRAADVNFCSSKEWQTGFVGREEEVDDNYYGLGMRSISSDPLQFTWVETTHSNPHGRNASIYEILSLNQPGGGTLLASIDDNQPILIPTDSPEFELNNVRLDTFEGSHRLTLSPAGDGPVRLFGVSMEVAGPGVLVDAIGIRGRMAKTWLRWDEDLFR